MLSSEQKPEAPLFQPNDRRTSSLVKPIELLRPRERYASVWLKPISNEAWREAAPRYQAVLRTPSWSEGSESVDSSPHATRLNPRRYLPTVVVNTLEESVSQVTKRINVGAEWYFTTVKTFESTSSVSKMDEDASLLHEVIVVRRKTPFEIVDEYTDRFILLDTRKSILRIWQGFRELCHLISSNRFFQAFIILAILFNTIILALEDPTVTIQPEPYHSIDLALLYIYTGEMGLKMIAMGVFPSRGSYFRETWNIMDCLVVVTGWIELYTTGSGVNFSALRALRILRPLRSITRIKGMKVVFMSLMGSARVLLSSIALLLFFYLITSIAALQMFMGVLKYRCMDIDTGYVGSSWDDSRICGNRICNIGQECIKSLDNPNYGKSNFDNLLMSMLTIFQSVTLEGWTVILIDLEKAFNLAAAGFYIPVIFLGAFFFNNMTLVAMKSAVRTT